MSDDKELIEQVALALAEDGGELALPWSEYHEDFREAFRIPARTAIAAVRAYDREQRAKIDAALALHIDEALARHNDAQHGGASTYVDPAQPVALGYWSRRMAEARRREMSGDAIADAAPASDPDDYRDPFALVTRMDSAPGIKT